MTTKEKIFLSILVVAILILLSTLLFVFTNVFADESMQTYCSNMPVITPTPTPTPEPTPAISEQAANSGYGVVPNNPSTNTTSTPGSATCNIAHVPPVNLTYDRVTPTSVKWTWGLSTDSMDNQAINYGYSPNSLIYGVILPSTSNSYTVGDLIPDHVIYAQVCGYKNGCGYCSQIIDP